MTKSSLPPVAWLLLVALSIIWGSSFLLINLGLDAFTPMQVGAVRLTFAGLVLVPFMLRDIRRLSRRELGLLIVIGITGNGIPSFLFPLAERVVPTAVAGVLNALTPIFTVLIAFLFFQDRYPLLKTLGLMVGLGGTVILVLAGSSAEGSEAIYSQGTYIEYSLYAVLATLCYGISLNITKTYFPTHSPILISSVALSAMALPSIGALALDPTFIPTLTEHPEGWASFGYIAILGAVGTALATILFYRMLQLSNLIFATSVTYTIPVIALLWGVFLLDERLGFQHFLGFSVILLGVFMVNRNRG